MAVASTTELRMLIGGEWVESVSGQWQDVRSPATGAVVGRVPKGTAADVDRAVAAAREAFNDQRWRGQWLPMRCAVLNKLADLIERDLDELVALEVAQTGTAIKFRSANDIPFAPDNLRQMAAAARHLDGRAAAEYSTDHTSMIRREPIGVAGQVAPWNYPFMMAIWKIGPALAAGNSVVLKPASSTPLTTLKLGALAEEAGLPPGVLNIVTGPGDEVGAAIAGHMDIDIVSLTGDSATGVKIQQLAAANLKRVHLELGGKAPFIVFADADLEAAARGAVAGSFINAGQDCTAATRIYVERPAYETFLGLLKGFTEEIRIGDPSDPSTDLGTLISATQVARVQGFVDRAVAAGARLVTGGAQPVIAGLEGGAFFQPTVLADVAQDSECVQQEIFGPVLTVMPFDTEDEAIAKGNDTRYGLAASVWTSNIQVGMRAAKALNFGTVWINDHLPLSSDTPHGGFKQSGFGKDMSSYSFDEYTQVKHVMVELTGATRKGWHYQIWGDAPEG